MQEIYEMTRQVGQILDTRFYVERDNENVNFGGSEAVSTGDARGEATDAPIGDDRLLHVAEAAEYLRVSQSLVYKMIERGDPRNPHRAPAASRPCRPRRSPQDPPRRKVGAAPWKHA